MDTTNTADQSAGKSRRAWPVLLLALPAFVAIWSGWVELGRLTGFGPVSPLPGIWDEATIDTAITLPIGVETYAAYAMYVWLALDVSDRARRFARVSAIGSLVLGAAGQVAYHLMAAAGIVKAPWPVTALVACLPVIVLGMGAALAHLVADGPAAVPDGGSAEQDQQYQEDAEARTERAVLVNGIRERRPDWPDLMVEATADIVMAGDELPPQAQDTDAADVRPDQTTEVENAPVPIRPAPADQARSTRSASRKGAKSNADKARALREKHPDWTVARIAERVGVTERTARRYFNPAPAAQSDAEHGDLAA